MKKIMLSIFIIGLCWSCKDVEKEKENIEKNNVTSVSFDWLLGKWKRVNEQEGKQTFESWEKISDTEYEGIGLTTQNSDTIWQEDIKLILRDSVWNFEVTGEGEIQPTIFRITNINSERFDSENPENEFPNVISYYRDGEKLQAIISAGETEISFEFVPIKK